AGFVVDGAALDAPTVVAAVVDLDARRLAGVGEGLLQHVLVGGRALVVVGGDGGVDLGLHLGDQQVRAGRGLGDQAAAVAGDAGADAVRDDGGGAVHQRAAHAVALRAGLLL